MTDRNANLMAKRTTSTGAWYGDPVHSGGRVGGGIVLCGVVQVGLIYKTLTMAYMLHPLLRQNDKKVLMTIEINRSSAVEASVKWTAIPNASAYSIILSDPRTINGEWTFHANNEENDFKFPVTLKPGHKYSVTIKAHKLRFRDQRVIYQTIHTAHATFRAVFTLTELTELHQRAEQYVRKAQDFTPIHYFYRNKPEEYFNHIHQTRKGIMEVYLKDDNGDPASIINGEISGLFFGTRVEPETGKPPNTSFFGEKRFYVPAPFILSSDSVRLYFADFYCNNRAHYVTLVLTHRGTSTDKFCQANLIELNTYQNQFLFKGNFVFVTRKIHVEVLYTENIDVNDWCMKHNAFFDRVELNKGTSTPGGLPKNPNCTICNLRRPIPEDDDEIN